MKNSNIQGKRTTLPVRNCRLALSLAIVLLTAACVNAQNVIVQWDAIASTTIRS